MYGADALIWSGSFVMVLVVEAEVWVVESPCERCESRGSLRLGLVACEARDVAACTREVVSAGVRAEGGG